MCGGASLLIAAAAFAFITLHPKRLASSKPLVLDILIGTNGTPTLLGIPLEAGRLQDKTLRALKSGQVPVRILNSPGPNGDVGSVSNFLQTINGLAKAGLIPTNGPSGPSPYE